MVPRARGGRGLTKFCSNHKIFTTKIKTFANLERFTKFLCHENLELYGTLLWTYMQLLNLECDVTGGLITPVHSLMFS